MIKWHQAVFLIVLLFACNSSPYDGYKRLDEDVHMHLHMIGDGEDFPKDGDSLLFRVRMGREGGTIGELFSTEEWYATKDLRKGAFGNVLHRIHEGDSMSVIAPTEQWPWNTLSGEKEVEVPDTGMIRVELSLVRIRTESMRLLEDEALRASEPYIYERKLVHAYLKQEKVPFERWGTSDMYFRLKAPTVDTTRARNGDQVTISYRGKNMEDGIVFDDTKRNGMPLTFRFGDKDQVMKGLEYAIGILREGQEGVFLFPSEFAFGDKGVPGLVEPNMPVIYTVHLEKVERGMPIQPAH